MGQRIKRNNWDDVYAIKNGVVTHSFFSQAYGNTVLVKDADGVTARYAHLHSVNPAVTIGARVTEGQVIGVMGATGNGVPKPNKHLHISVYPAGTKEFCADNAKINPEIYIRGGTYPANTYVSTPFHFRITPAGKAAYLHEGTDFSGLQKNLIPGWQQGITGAPPARG